MKFYNRKQCCSVVVIFCFALLFTSVLSAQDKSVVRRGQVTDPAGAAITNANVVMTPVAGSPVTTQTNAQGIYEFKGLAPGKYTLNVIAQGFTTYENYSVVITQGGAQTLNISLTIEVEEQKVQVSDSTHTVDESPSNNAGAIVISGKALEALPDDPDELQSDLEALAGPSAGPNGGQTYIDGFLAGQLPPKASIREIRINQNPFSSEYDKLGYGRIEIFTKPGTDKLHGQLQMLGNASAFNARSSFENLPAGVSPPDYNSQQYSGNVGGPINKKASFFFNIERRNIGALNVVNGSVICGDPFARVPCPAGQAQFSLIPSYSAAIPFPQTRTNLSPRIDYQLTPNNTLTVRYQYFRDVVTNANVGLFNLPETGTDTLGVEHTFQATDTQIIGAHAINESRFQFIHADNESTPLQTGTTVDVGGAFKGNGSGGVGALRHQQRQ